MLQDGTIRAWGGNKFGQVGDGTTEDRPTPVRVPAMGKVVAIATSPYVSAAVLADGRVLTWGQLAYRVPTLVPTLVPGIVDGRAIALGDGYVLLLTHAGTVVSWGEDKLGQLGHGSTRARALQPDR